MKANKPFPRFVLVAALLALPFQARAGTYVSTTLGSGPNGYHSTEVDADADLFDTPLSLNLLGFKSSSSAQEDVSQSALGIDWRISRLAKLGIRHNRINNGSIDIRGNSLGLALTLNTLWNSDLISRIDLKRTDSAYQFNDLPPAVQNDTINQTGESLGLSQDVATWLTVYGGRDRYSYDHNPVNAALVLMLKAPRKYINTSSSLLSFPDTTTRFGLTLIFSDALSLDISSSRTTTQTDQELRNKRLGIDYQVTDHVNVSLAVSRATSTAVVTKKDHPLIPAGTTVMPATDDKYTEFSLGWTF